VGSRLNELPGAIHNDTRRARVGHRGSGGEARMAE